MAIRFVRNQRGTDFTVHDERYPNIQCAVQRGRKRKAVTDFRVGPSMTRNPPFGPQ